MYAYTLGYLLEALMFVFFTRWVTHFCAPAFVFLSGTSAFLYGRKINNTSHLTKYLITRGLLLVALEFTLIRFFWTFNFSYAQFTLAGVIWMLGCCMILLGLMVRLKPMAIGIIGLAIILFQNFFALVPLLLPETTRQSFGVFWEFIYSSGLDGPPSITILYVIVPWIGVMAAGYGFGLVLQKEETVRKKLLIRIGLASIISFIIFATIAYLSADQHRYPFLLSILNQRKYPASQLFLLMTLGPSILLMAYVEKAKHFISQAIIIFGKVPLFYYLLHIPLIHISALVVQLIKEGKIFPEWYDNAPYVGYPQEHWWSLGILYLVFIIDVIMLYFVCKWYVKFKFNHPEIKWVKFL